MILAAPALAPTDVILLPDPIKSNEQGQKIAMSLKLTRNGDQHTHVKRTESKTLNYTFQQVGRGKVVELQEFLKLHSSAQIRITDHRDQTWTATLLDSSLSAAIQTKATPVLEACDFTLSFVGTLNA